MKPAFPHQVSLHRVRTATREASIGSVTPARVWFKRNLPAEHRGHRSSRRIDQTPRLTRIEHGRTSVGMRSVTPHPRIQGWGSVPPADYEAVNFRSV